MVDTVKDAQRENYHQPSTKITSLSYIPKLPRYIYIVCKMHVDTIT